MAAPSKGPLIAGVLVVATLGLAAILGVLGVRPGSERNTRAVERIEAEPVLPAPGSADPAPDRPAEEDGERRSPLAEAATYEAAIYALFDPEGHALAEAWVALWKPGGILASGRTNDQGEFRLEPAEEATGKLLVVDSRLPPQVLDVSLDAGRHVVVLRRGAAIAGHVVVTGGRPLAHLPLSLSSFVELLDLEAELSLEWSRLDLPPYSGRWLRTRTDERGFFRFQGLPEGWSGELRLPVEYRLEDQTLAGGAHALNVLVLEAPVEDLLVRVVRRATLAGRVVELPGRQPVPVPGAVVMPELEFPPAEGRPYLGEARTDVEGRFKIALPSPSIRGGKVRISPGGREHFREIEVQAVEVEGELDLGDLALGDYTGTRPLPLQVLDESLQPVEGAVAAMGETSPSSPPTDAGGRTELAYVVPGITTFAVYALGYEVAEVAVPLELPEVLEVMLRRTALLDLRFLQPSGEVARGVRVRLASARTPYRSVARPRNYKGYTQSGASYYRIHTLRDGTVVVRLFALGEGRVVLNDLEPGLPLDLRVEGPYGGVILEEPVPPLQSGEHRVQSITLPVAPKVLSGRVLDEAGSPLPQALISVILDEPDVAVPRASNMTSGVRADGSFEIGGIYAPTVWFSASASGYARFTDSRCEVPEEGRFLEIRLSRGKVVTVTVEDEMGRRCSPASLGARRPGGETVGTRMKVEGEEGTYLLQDLPEGEVTIRAYIHGQTYNRIHDTRIPELTFIVPAAGEVLVSLHLFDESLVDSSWLLCLVPTSDPSRDTRYAWLHDPQIPGVLPGSYFVVLRRFPEGFERMEEFVETSPRVPVEVEAGLRAVVDVWQQP